MFLSAIDSKHKQAQARFGEIRKVLREAIMPGATDFGLSLALKLPRDVHDRLEEAAGRHGLRSLKDTAFRAMLLGLATMERLPAEDKPVVVRGHRAVGRVLSEEEISRLRSEGFDAPRVPVPPKHYCDDDEELVAPRAAAG